MKTELTNKSSSIAVVGMACYYPGARGLREFWENILARRVQFRKILKDRLPLSDYYDPNPSTPDKTYGSKAAVIDGFEFDWISRRIPKSAYESTDIVHWLALETALKALEDGGFSRENIPAELTGVIVGNTLTGEQTRAQTMRLRWPFVRRALQAAAKAKGLSPVKEAELTQVMEEYYKSVFAPVTEDTLAGGLSNTISGRICNFLDLHGGGYTVDGACSSSLLAIANASSALINRDLNLALAGGVDISLDTFELVGFSKTGALTKDEMTVYDRRASGFIPGEGSGFVVLKRLEDAKKDGDYIYATIRGWGISSDGKGGITAPNGKSQAKAIQRAYARAGYQPREVDFIEGHGTGTTVGDIAELEGISIALGSNASPRSCGVTSLKSIIGHTKAASGIGGFIKTVMAVNQRVLPPTAGCTYPNSIFENEARSLYPILSGEIKDSGKILKAGVTGAGFGGINCHVTLESGDPPSQKLKPSIDARALLVSNQKTELFIFSAKSIAGLLDKIKEIREIVSEISIAEFTDLSAKLIGEMSENFPVRAAIIAGASEELLDMIIQLETMLKEKPPVEGKTLSNIRHTIWIGNKVNKSKTGFLFPGQGSQRLNMGKVIAERFPFARNLIKKSSEWLEDVGSEAVDNFIFKSVDKAVDPEQIEVWEKALTRTAVAQPAICLTSLLYLKRLERLGIQPVAAGGHSLGELSAFYAAGALDEKSILQLAAVRGQAMAVSANKPGAMASLTCSLSKAELIIQNVEGYVITANINAPNQVVISGEEQSVNEAVTLANIEGVRATKLQVSNAFHSRLVSAASEHLLAHSTTPEIAEKINLKLFSSIDGKLIKEGLNMRSHFAEQILSQVNFVAMVEAISEECDIMLEVGPGRVLSHLVSSIIGKKDIECFPVESSAGNDRDLLIFLGKYFVSGGKANWQMLNENRLVRAFVKPSEKAFIKSPLEREFAEASLSGKNNFELNKKIESELAGKVNLSYVEFRNYLSQRGDFLKNIIQADVRSKNYIPEKNKAEKKEKEAIPEIKETDTAASALLSLISERTGFPEKSLSMDMHILDDLNIDSIKGAELIAAAAKRLKISGDINPSSFTKGKLSDIADKLMELKHEKLESKDKTSILELLKQLISEHTGFPKKTLKETMKLLDDLNLDSIKSAELLAKAAKKIGITGQPGFPKIAVATLGEIAEVFSEYSFNKTSYKVSKEPWVRYFVLKDSEKPLLPELGRQINFLVVSDNKSYAKTFLKQHPQVKSISFEDINSIGNFSEFDQCVFIFPKEFSKTENKIEETVEKLRSAAFLVSEFDKLKKDKSVICVQFKNNNYEKVSLNCVSSFFASLHLEHSDVKTKIINFGSETDSKNLINCISRELNTEENFCVVNYDKNLTRTIQAPELLESVKLQKRNINWTSDDVIVVTGGAKGITAECAFEFAQKTGVKMALVGSSRLTDSNREVTKTLKKYDDAGLTAEYFQCDITDFSAVSSMTGFINRNFGEITGVIHGAGLNVPRKAETVTTEEVFKEISPKIFGAENLDKALKNNSLKLFAGLTSIIGISGMQGNAWYGFSNEVLDALLGKVDNRRKDTAVVSMAFSIWDEVGMGERLGTKDYLENIGIKSIPVKEGVKRFLKLIEFDPGERQVIIAAKMSGLDTWKTKEIKLKKDLRFLDKISFYYPDVEVVSRVQLDIEKDDYVKDHVWRGTYLFPAVFGLEAMAQAVSAVSGKQNFSRLRIENIIIDRPIVVDPESGVEIEVTAEVLERARKQAGTRIKTGITTSQSNFSENHFSAEFILEAEGEAEKEKIVVPEMPLDISPVKDLYGQLLFQGMRFQQLDKVYKLNSREIIFSRTGKTGKTERTSADHRFLLGNPFSRDALFQSLQLTIPKDICLPIGIDKIELTLCPDAHERDRDFQSKFEEKEIIICRTILEEKIDQTYRGSVSVVDEKGEVKEKIEGYLLKILEHHDENPTAEELANPGRRDESIIQSRLDEFAKQFDFQPAKLTVIHEPDIHDLPKSERHKIEIPALKRAALGVLDDSFRGAIAFEWLPSGKPIVKGTNGSDIDVSVSHEDGTVLCSAGHYPHGCDIIAVKSRDFDEWVSLLGNPKREILRRLTEETGSVKKSGARIWAAVEAIKKATGANDPELELDFIENEIVVFKNIFSEKELKTLTFPVKLTRKPEKIVAIVFQKAKVENNIPQIHLQRGTKIQNPKFKIQNSYEADISYDTDGRIISKIRFPVTFKEASNSSKTLYFSNFFVWIGKLRELMIQPVVDKLVEEFSTGKWGMVTNHAETGIYQSAKPGDVIEGKFWLDSVSGEDKSTLNLCFEWLKLLPGGEKQKIASSSMSTTWVEIIGHGIVRVRPFSGFMREYVEKLLPKNCGHKLLERQEDEINFGHELYHAPPGPTSLFPVLREQVFETSIEDGNLVGNIYFANYYKWQGRVRDNFLHSLKNKTSKNIFFKGELRCVECKVNHVAEAMPFDKIVVVMGKKAVLEKGLVFSFDYYRLNSNGSREKLAFGEHKACWFAPDENNNWMPESLPREIYNSLNIIK